MLLSMSLCCFLASSLVAGAVGTTPSTGGGESLRPNGVACCNTTTLQLNGTGSVDCVSQVCTPPSKLVGLTLSTNATSLDLNNASSTGLEPQRKHGGKGSSVLPDVLTAVFAVIMAVGVTGNAIVIYIFLGEKSPHSATSTTDLLIVYLAVVDLVLSVLNPSLFIYWLSTRGWHFGLIACKTLPALAIVSTNMSAAIILIMTVDRYRVVVQPLRGHFSRRHIRLALVVSLVLSTVTCYHRIMHQTIFMHYGCVIPRTRVHSFATPEIVFLSMRCFVFLLILVTTTTCIYVRLESSRLRFDSGNGRVADIKRKSDNRKVLRLLSVMGAVFVLLVFPRDILQIVYSVSWYDGSGIIYSPTIRYINHTFKALLLCNSCVNIFIYSRLHRTFRRSFLSKIRTALQYVSGTTHGRYNSHGSYRIAGKENGHQSPQPRTKTTTL